MKHYIEHSVHNVWISLQITDMWSYHEKSQCTWNLFKTGVKIMFLV